jgi:hypothetical protein
VKHRTGNCALSACSSPIPSHARRQGYKQTNGVGVDRGSHSVVGIVIGGGREYAHFIPSKGGLCYGRVGQTTALGSGFRGRTWHQEPGFTPVRACDGTV